MPSKSLNQIKKDKAFKTIAVFAMVFLFVSSLLIAIVLPFVDTVGVAEAYSIDDFDSRVALSSLTSDVAIYGFALSDDFVSVLNSQFSGYSQTIIDFSFNSLGTQSFLYLDLGDVQAGTWSLYFSYEDKSSNNVLIDNSQGEISGLFYVIFDKPFYSDFPSLTADQNKIAGSIFALTQAPYVVPEVWSPSAFSSTFVTMSQTPSPSVFVNMASYPILPDYSLFVNDNGVYGFELFDTYTTDGSAMGFYGRVNTGWQYEAKFNGVGSTATLSHWIVSLYVGFSLVYSCKVTPGQGSTTASEFNNGTISEQTWHVPRSFDFGDLPIYQYSSSNGGYMHILKSSSTVGSWQFGTKGWSNYIALFDLRNGFDKDTSGLYNAGVAEGQGNLAQAKEDSYKQGYSEGSSVGYNKGYSAGINDSNQYTFMSLIGAVFDAPISAFRGLFSFEILGVDMTAFVSSLFALAVIVVIIKIALGGGK